MNKVRNKKQNIRKPIGENKKEEMKRKKRPHPRESLEYDDSCMCGQAPDADARAKVSA